MATAFDNEAQHDALRALRAGATNVRDVLEEAQALAARAEQLLANLSQDRGEANAFRIRLARAHALSLLDQLSELLEVRPAGYGPPVRDCAAPIEDEDSISGVRQAPWSRAATSSRKD
jgi:hypothetical protein